MTREDAEKHLKYTEEVAKLSGNPLTEREKFLYVEAMLHGDKHGREDASTDTKTN